MRFNNEQKIYIDRISDDCIISDNKFLRLLNFLLLNNYKIVQDVIDSDIIIMDLCGFREDFLNTTEKKINLYKESRKHIILFGCISDRFKEQYKDSLLYINGKNISEIETLFDFLIGINKVNILDSKNKVTIYDTGSYKSYNTKNKIYNKEELGFIHISDGCSLNCSYCNIKKIKGNTVSIGIEQILDEIKLELLKGKTEFYLLSDDCGSYGIDIGTDFVTLIDRIYLLDDRIKLKVTNIYPLFFIRFYDRLKKYFFDDKITSIVIPVQHTSSRVLGLMRRNYNISTLKELLDEIRRNSKVELLNHIIFDYHEETMDEFKDALSLMKYYHKTVYIRYSDINNVFGKSFESFNLKDKVTLLKKVQAKYGYDIVSIVY